MLNNFTNITIKNKAYTLVLEVIDCATPTIFSKLKAHLFFMEILRPASQTKG